MTPTTTLDRVAAGRPASWFAAIPILFMINAALGIAHHRLWFDEVQSWSLVRDSPTIAALFHNLEYEGHPGLWYLMLWGAQRITLDPIAMKICHWLIAAASIGLIGYFSPFRKRDRILLMAGYFLAFQYVVICRNYGIGMFLGFLYAYLESNHPARKYSLYLTLGLLANCNAFTFLFSGVLAMNHFFEALTRRSKGERPRDEGLGLCLYALFAGLAIWTLYPPADMAYAGVGTERAVAQGLATGIPAATGLPQSDYIASTPLTVLLRLSYISPEFFSTIAINSRFWQYAVYSVIGLAAILFTVLPFLVLYPVRRVFRIHVLTFAVVFAFCDAVYRLPSFRHIGVLWLSFVVCYWIKSARDGKTSSLASLVFALSALWGAYSTAHAYRTTYANSEAAASWVRDQGLQTGFWISYDDHAGVPLSAFLGIPTYSLECHCLHNHIVWNNRRSRVLAGEVGSGLVPIIGRLPGRVAYLIDGLSKAVDQDELTAGLSRAGIRSEVLQRFDTAKTDNYVLYKLIGPGPLAPAAQ